MFGLPEITELNKQLPKKAIYAKFQMNTAAKEKIDRDISRITIVNELTSSKTNIAEGKTVRSIFVVLVSLKRSDFSENSIITISKLIPQNMIFVLEYEDKAELAVYHEKLLHGKWQSKDDIRIDIKGLDFDKVWENIIIQIGDIELEGENTLDEQIAVDDRREKLQKEIEKLEKQARAEKQPKKKFEIFKRIKEIENTLK